MFKSKSAFAKSAFRRVFIHRVLETSINTAPKDHHPSGPRLGVKSDRDSERTKPRIAADRSPICGQALCVSSPSPEYRRCRRLPEPWALPRILLWTIFHHTLALDSKTSLPLPEILHLTRGVIRRLLLTLNRYHCSISSDLLQTWLPAFPGTPCPFRGYPPQIIPLSLIEGRIDCIIHRRDGLISI